MTHSRSSEADISEAVLRVLSGRPNGEATIAQLKRLIPSVITLTAGDRQQSITRPNEELWEQLVRNIVSHKTVDGNYIYKGYLVAPSRGRLRITSAGRHKIGA